MSEMKELEKRVNKLEKRNKQLENVVSYLIRKGCKNKDSEECKTQYEEIGYYICMDCEL